MTRAAGKHTGRRRVMTSPEQSNEEQETRPVELFAATDGKHGRSVGIYLDMEERKQAEIIRAQREGREPRGLDPDSHHELPPTVGTQLVPKAYLAEGVSSYPSILVDGTIDNTSDPLVQDEAPVEAAQEVDLSHAALIAKERKAQEDALADVEEPNDSVGDVDPSDFETGDGASGPAEQLTDDDEGDGPQHESVY